MDQHEIVGSPFLGPARFGLEKRDDQTIRDSLVVGDRTRGLPRDDTPNGALWHGSRSTATEQADGEDCPYTILSARRDAGSGRCAWRTRRVRADHRASVSPSLTSSAGCA